MSKPARIVVGLLIAILFAGAIALLRLGVYGWTVFVIFPILLGALASWVFRPTTGGQAARPVNGNVPTSGTGRRR